MSDITPEQPEMRPETEAWRDEIIGYRWKINIPEYPSDPEYELGRNLLAFLEHKFPEQVKESSIAYYMYEDDLIPRFPGKKGVFLLKSAEPHLPQD